MKKRLLVVFSIFVLVVVLVLLMGAAFGLKSAEISLYAENGKEILDNSGIDPSLLIKDFIGKSVLFLPESKIIESIHSNPLYTQWRVVAIEKNFPNTIRIHMTKRLPVFSISHGGAVYAIDSEGYVIGPHSQYAQCLSLNDYAKYIDEIEIGSYLKFNNEQAQSQLDILLQMIRTSWELHYDYNEMHTFISDFGFEKGNLRIYTRTGAQFVIEEPSSNLHDKLISAYGVYSDTKKDMTGEGVVITVNANGSIVSNTPSDN